jgi:tetratricopeptide (TPR) repeat protein
LPIIREVGDPELEGTTLQNIAVVHSYQNQYQEALEFYEQALSIIQKLSNRTLEGRILCNIGEVNYFLGHYKQALKFYEQALALSREMGDRDLEGDTLKNIGKIYHDYADQYRLSEALQLLEEGIEQLNSDRHQAALKTLQQALRIFQAISNLSREEALSDLRKNGQYGEVMTLIEMGECYCTMAHYLYLAPSI